ncbi:hypothetical protein [Paraglaciecola polaris]|uniref:Uncharacterized protein n=1 Tax=Paraglaciecola polaris LMG 21857 TaxID=1129793 RepID=K7A7X0_9ALTE|nr:hypothetical protein [Paraglaciecola polaris]GAC31555.1 hypothetical protein GPLA_0639 [Paraglaciecola polaris LMG 21857]|tara:strand:+ start:4597 stop:4866 length:270 start_codon:yes stop_codon:yes gene_type:complete
MCSSPKSSGSRRPRSAPSKSFAEGFTAEQRARFTDVANRAEQRREKRLATDKRWKQAQDNSANKAPIVKAKQQVKAGLFSRLARMLSGQ